MKLSHVLAQLTFPLALASFAGAQEIGVEYCTSNANSSGAAGELQAFGIPEQTTGIVALLATRCPPNQPGFFIYGTDQAALPFADGVLCIAGSGSGIIRILPAAVTDTAGNALHWLTSEQLSVPPGGPPGNLTVNYQLWFRDPAAGLSGSNLTSAVAVTYLPCTNCE